MSAQPGTSTSVVSLPISPEHELEQQVLRIRGMLVMLDSDLARLYGETTKRLNQQVSRNSSRFPPDFMFQLAGEEIEALRLHFATSKPGRGGRRTAPRVFTEQGVAMLSSVLKSQRAVEVNIAIMRAFVRLRQLTTAHGRLARKVDQLEQQMDAKFRVVFTVIEKLSAAPGSEQDTPKRRIGFHRDEAASAAHARVPATRSAPPAGARPGASSPR